MNSCVTGESDYSSFGSKRVAEHFGSGGRVRKMGVQKLHLAMIQNG